MAAEIVEVLLRARGDFSDLTGKISGLRKEFQNLKLPKDITANLEKGFNRLDPILKSYQKQLDKGFKTKTDLKNFEATRHELDAIFSDIISEIQKVNGQPVQLKADLKEITALEKKLDGFGEKLQKALDKITIKEGGKVTNEINKLVTATSKASTIKPMTIKARDLFNQQDFVAFNNEIDKIQNKILNLSNVRGAKVDLAKAIMGPNFTNDVNAMDEAIKRFFNDLKVSEKSMTGLAEINNDITKTGQALNQVKTDSLTKGVQALSDFGTNAQQASQQAKGLGDSIDGAASSSVRMAEELQQLKTSTQYFFSLRNMINLFKRGVQEAVEVIKELDAAMTETAVVTDFSVGDMWKKLPEYTANANALGASVKDMYEATTLYYQQGLDTNAAMGIANETMKMARIGGLEAADATDKMTAALRGFNMELNETSAQRVNDVYSNLAAKTASDTEELGTAMQRTASIAASAGMSFEGTAAFLAQAIETTREPAENLGTAMKTIVARFTELKKNPLEITEVDGEEVDYNKVDTALKSIGVSLKDANGQFRDLDKVFLDIAQRWDSLTQTQQRYVATTAAGSRQQSRFIAMMSNYERTVELMDYANNSAGASNEQFGKTMESLEAKLNKLKNAWNEFLMGIMNDSMTKFVVDAGTTLLGILNKITDVLSFGGKSGLLKSITSLTAAFMGLKVAGKAINWGVDKAGGLLSPSTPMFGFKGEGGKVNKTTTTIVNPIVAEIRRVVAAIKGQSVVKAEYDKIGTVQQYKNSQANLRTLLGLNDQKLISGDKIDPQRSIKYSQITDNLKNLSDDQQRQLLGTLPGLQQAMRGTTLDLLKNNNVSKNSQRLGQQITKDIIQGMNKGAISVEKGIDLLRNPQKWGQYFGNKFNEGNLQEISTAVTGPEFNKLVQEAQDKYAQAVYRGQNADRSWLSEEEIAAKQADFEKYARRKLKNKAPIEEIDYTQYSQLGDKIGQVGAGFATAGQSVQQFGITLSNLGLEKAGALLMRVGSSISSLGMAFSGLGTILPKIQERFADAGAAAVEAFNTAGKGVGGVASGGGAFFSTLFGSGAAAAAAGIGVAAVAAIAIQKYLEKKAKEAGEEVRKQFEEKFTKANEKISSLEGYENRFNELAKGVDQFGHNVSLTSEEYSEYLSISRELQQLSPSLIAGYNAEGEAIIKKGSAIQDVINKLKEEKQAELDLFTSNTSIDKLIGEYQTSNAHKNNKEKGHTEAGDYIIDQRAFSSAASAIARIGDENLLQSINQLSSWNLDSLNNLTTAQLSWLSKHYNDVINLVEEQNGALEDEVREGYIDAFTNAGSTINEVMTEGKPIIDAMQMWMGDQKLDAIGLGLGEEFSNSFNQGVEGIMLTGLTKEWTPDQFKTNLKDYANEWKRLAAPTSQYADILADADEIQQQYLDHIGETDAITDYENNIEGLALQLEQLAEQYKGTGAAGEAFAEQCIAQANALRNYATEGALSLGEALNSLSDEFSSARGAKERFDKATEGGDYYTAAEGYKSIIDTVLDDKNRLGEGSLTGWAGAEELLGQTFVDNNSWNDIVKQIQRVQDCFTDGADGVAAFNKYLVESWEAAGGAEGALAGLGTVVDGGFEFNLQNEDLAEYAELLNLSEDALAALIDKARQWIPINLGDPGKIRQAIETSGQSITGTSSKGESLVYTSESKFRSEARQQGIRGDDYTKTKSDAEERGVRFLNVENLTAKNGDGLYADKVLENIGLTGQDKTVENAVAAFTKMGLDLEDTKKVLTSEGIKLANGEEATEENIERAYDEQAYALENPTVAGIADNTDTLVSNTSAMLAAMGVLTESAKQDINNNTSDDTIKGYTDLLGKDFKTTSERTEARAQVESQRDAYQETIDLYAKGGLTADNNEYIAKLVAARDKLNQALENEATSWESKINEYSDLFSNISEQFVTDNTVDFANAFAIDDIMQSAEALRQLENEGNLSYESMRTLAAEFMQLHQAELMQFDSTQLDELATKLGLTRDEAIGLLGALNVPFALEGRLTGDDLETYINKIDTLTTGEKEILLNAELTGDEKVDDFIDKIDSEFGDGTAETKSVIIQATTALANGDQGGAQKILEDAGFSDGQVQEITQKLSILVDGSVANPGEVKEALQQQLNGLDLKTDAQVNVKANISKDIGKIGTSVNVDTKGIDAAKQKADSTKGTMTVDANIDNAKKKIDSLRNIKDASITVNAKKGTGWVQTMSVKVNEHDARGRNFSIPAHQSLSFGSAASGMNIPKSKSSSKQKITALVGEEGYEVGYIPSEQRSVIFGANGPEMTSFPSDTVIYPHEQSKEILRRGKNGIPTFGSFSGGDNISSGNLGKIGGKSSKKSSKKSSSKSKKSKKKSKKKDKKEAKEQEIPKIINYSIEETIRFNLDANLAKLGYEIDKRTKAIDKSLSKIGVTSKDIAGSVQSQLSALESQRNTNQAILDSYKRQSNEIFNWQETISYQDWTTKTETTGKGKKKKTTTTTELGSVDGVINLRDYMIQQADGSYIANEQAIRAAGNASRQKAIQDAVSNAVSSINSGMINAQKNIDEANEKMAELGQQVSEAFYQWENELTQVYNLTQRIDEEMSLTDRFSSQVALELAKLNAGFGETANSINNIRKTLIRNNETLQRQIKDQQELIAARKTELNNALSADNEKALLKVYQGKTNWSSKQEKEATLDYQQQQVAAAEIARKYVTDLFTELDGSIRYVVNWEQIEKDRIAGNLTKTTYDALKSKIDELNDASTAYNNTIKETTDLVAEQYQQLRDYQDTIGDFEETLIDGLEEIKNNEAEALKDISDSISDALSDLLDEVKRRLEERRQREDNLKTEEDISRKQQRLAALRANTAGGNQVEIAQLEKELAEAQQSYQRTLEDQLLDRLQQQGDEAAKQRERQIELLEAQAEIDSSTNKELVALWLKDPEAYKQQIFEAWKKANDYESKGEVGQYLLEQTFESGFAELVTAVEQTGFDNHFQSIEEDLNTLIGLIQNSEEFKPAEEEVTEKNTTSMKTLKRDLEGAKKARELGNTVKQLKDELGFNDADIIGAGYTTAQLREGKYSASTLLKYNKTPADLKAGGYTAKELKDAGITDLATLKRLNYTAANLKDAGYTAKELSSVGFNRGELRTAGFRIKDLNAFSGVADLKTAGFTNVADFKAAGYTYAQLKSYFTNDELANAGYAEAIELRRQQELKQKQDKYNSLLNNFMSMSSWYSPSLVKQLLDAGKALNKTPGQVGEDLGMKGLKEGIYRELLFGKSDFYGAFHKFNWGGSSGVSYSDINAIVQGIRRGYNKRLSNLDPWERNRLKNSGLYYYKTGGLNTTTGPAWLDGTPSKPELVLNSTDTKNFLALRDVLSKAMGSTKSINNSYGGDNIFEININVDKIEKDYDVDRVADRVKKKILESSSYRNVTQVRNFR